MSQTCQPTSCLQPVARPARSGLMQRMLAAIAIRRSRARLLDLDDRILRDIGVSRHDAEAEARRPLWDAPDHWKR